MADALLFQAVIPLVAALIGYWSVQELASGHARGVHAGAHALVASMAASVLAAELAMFDYALAAIGVGLIAAWIVTPRPSNLEEQPSRPDEAAERERLEHQVETWSNLCLGAAALTLALMLAALGAVRFNLT